MTGGDFAVLPTASMPSSAAGAAVEKYLRSGRTHFRLRAFYRTSNICQADGTVGESVCLIPSGIPSLIWANLISVEKRFPEDSEYIIVRQIQGI
jgi:hypothetical protein